MPGAVGTSTRRIEGVEKITGEQQFAGDLKLPGMLHARLVLSPYGHARIVKIDASAALAMPGVVSVLTGNDLPIKKRDASRKGEPIAISEAVFNGHPVAVVLAESEAAAEDAVSLVEVEYEVLPSVMDPELARRPESALVRLHQGEGSGEENQHASGGGGEVHGTETVPPNVTGRVQFKRGDLAQGFAEADVIVERTYHTQWAHQAYLEPQSAVAWREPTGHMTIWSATQGIFNTRADVSGLLGIPAHQVKVIGMAVGGGFGGKFGLIDPLVAAIAATTNRPVRLVLTRSEDFYAANPQPQARIAVKIGATKDGRLTALQGHITYDSGAFPAGYANICSRLLGASYKWPNFDISGESVLTNRVSPGAYRAPGATQAYWALESTIEDVARELGLDSLEFRLKNAVAQGDPGTDGKPYRAIGMVECLEAIKKHPVWQQRHDLGPDEGVGIAAGSWPGGLESAGAGCRMDTDGTFTVVVGSVDLTGTNTGYAQIASDVLGMPLDKIRVVNGDTDTAPYAGAAGGSKTMLTVGAAVKVAAEDARRKVLAIAAEELEAAVDDLEIVDGMVTVKGVPSRSIPMGRIAALTRNKYAPIFGSGDSAITSNSHQFTVHMVKVKVDRMTGKVALKDYVVAQDVGHAINPALVKGQIAGGATQGIGYALYETMLYDDQGTLLTGSLMDYALPSAEDAPSFDSILVEVPSVDGPFGAKGVGEPPIIPGPAAIGNAIRAAIGVRMTSIPMTPESIIDALQAS